VAIDDLVASSYYVQDMCETTLGVSWLVVREITFLKRQ